MRRKTVAVPLAILGIVLTGHTAAQQPAAGQRKPIDAGDTMPAAPALDITAHTDDHIAGGLTRAALIDHTARMKAPSCWVVDVVVDVVALRMTLVGAECRCVAVLECFGAACAAIGRQDHTIRNRLYAESLHIWRQLPC